mmetsp:Transcript_34971/g.64758  ORF Transcript_34971/g.64758 Transcript_34971/m.64758 type:complete len:253 (-) Transcript_34971:157-915(-)
MVSRVMPKCVAVPVASICFLLVGKITALQSVPDHSIIPGSPYDREASPITTHNYSYLHVGGAENTVVSDPGPRLLSVKTNVILKEEHVLLNDGGYSDDGKHKKVKIDEAGMHHSGPGYNEASLACLEISGFLFVIVICAAIKGIAQEGWVHFRRVIDPLLGLWVALAGFCAYVCALSVTRGQGWYSSRNGITRASPRFVYDEHFVPMAIIGSASIGLVIATLIVQHLYPLPQPANAPPAAAAAAGASGGGQR